MHSTSQTINQIYLEKSKKVYYNLDIDDLIQHALDLDEGTLSQNGALVVQTGKYTGRTPKDKFVVKDETTKNDFWWSNNKAMSPETFEKLQFKAEEALKGKEIFVIDTFGAADPKYRIKARFICEKAWHALFIKQLLIRPSKKELESFEPDWTVIDLCEELCIPEKDGTDSEAVIAINFTKKMVLIMGTQYAGEMKKSIFTVMNALLPEQGVLSMHCSANIGEKGDTALFFGLSGTGKTTLSADPSRRLIGDDEHGWSDTGIFNIEGGCYAKCIRLSKEGEPQIWEAIRSGSVLENVILNAEGYPDYNDCSITENTRCAYPLEHISNAIFPSIGSHPKNIFFLTCDAFGVLPPISKLNPKQAMEYFLSGYTAKVAGTESGITEPKATFSACFGQPFLPLPPAVYAELLRQKIAEHGADVWLINTGWTGGPYGVGSRIKLQHTRAMLHAALDGFLKNVEFQVDPIFGLSIPKECKGVPIEILIPRDTWNNKDAYDKKATELAHMFADQNKTFELK